jgi:voltage-gated potassium channel
MAEPRADQVAPGPDRPPEVAPPGADTTIRTTTGEDDRPADGQAVRRAHLPIHIVLRRLAEAVGTVVASTLVYYLIPGQWGGALGSWAFAAAFSGGLVLVGGFILHQVRQLEYSRLGDNVSITGLVLALYVSVLFFAKVYDSLAVSRPGAMVGLSTKTDALYFSLSVASTTGFGDVHAMGQLARGAVAVQMAFNVGFVGLVLASVRRIVSAWTAPARELTPPTPDHPPRLDQANRPDASAADNGRRQSAEEVP